MNKLLNSIGIEKIGFVELIFAMYPILSGYQYGRLPLQLFVLVLLDIIIVLQRGNKIVLKQPNKSLIYLAIFVIVHELILFVTLPSVPSYFINLFISYVIFFASIFIIGPSLNFEKFEGSINLVALICMIGLLYQFPIIMSGGYTTPISLPFLPALDESARAFEELSRPSSFFWEPQSYCSFMFVPLFFALLRKKMPWAIAITISMFLSGSTTGIVISVFMFLYTTLFSKQKIGSKILIAVITVGLVYILFNSSLFEVGINKMETTNYNENSRLYNGITLVSRMPFSDLILGGNNATVADYYFSGAAGHAFLLEKNNTIYVATIWMIIVKFGIIGMFFYLWAYFKPILQRREIAPYALALFIMLFSNPDYISGMFVFEMIIINCYLINRKHESIYNNNPLCK